MAKFLINLLYSVVFLVSFSSAADESFVEDFNGGSLGIFSACSGRIPFVVKQYSENEDIVEKPEDANDFFITVAKETDHCIESESINVEVGSVLSLDIYTSNSGDPDSAFRWMVVNPTTGGNVQSAFTLIDDSKVWKTSTITMVRKATIKIRISFTKWGTGNEFMAIDSIAIDGERITTAASTPETTPKPSESTIPGTPEATTTTPITTTDYTTALPSSPSTTEPPSAPNCVCNCNCNYYCGKNPFH